MYRVYNPVTAEEQRRAETVIRQLIEEKGIKMHQLEKMLHTTTIKKIAHGHMRAPRETLERIVGLGETYGIRIDQ